MQSTNAPILQVHPQTNLASVLKPNPPWSVEAANKSTQYRGDARFYHTLAKFRLTAESWSAAASHRVSESVVLHSLKCFSEQQVQWTGRTLMMAL